MSATPTIAGPVQNPHPPTRLVLPDGACDAHCHVFGPSASFPFAPDRTYTPPDAGVAELLRLQSTLGLGRAVLVQASCHGTDNRAMLHALDTGKGRLAGVAMIGEYHTDADLEAMHRLGVRGIRFNFVSHLGGGAEPARVVSLAARVARRGWHLDLHFDAVELPRHADFLDSLPVPFIIDHMGRVSADHGIDQPAFAFLLGVLGSNNRAWVKISGAERVSQTGPPYADVVPFARALVETAPDRVLWGTDWPHPNVDLMPDDGDLVDWLADLVPDDGLRRRILVDNPEALYDFD